jgi:hypothetical protein
LEWARARLLNARSGRPMGPPCSPAVATALGSSPNLSHRPRAGRGRRLLSPSSSPPQREPSEAVARRGRWRTSCVSNYLFRTNREAWEMSWARAEKSSAAFSGPLQSEKAAAAAAAVASAAVEGGGSSSSLTQQKHQQRPPKSENGVGKDGVQSGSSSAKEIFRICSISISISDDSDDDDKYGIIERPKKRWQQQPP